MHIFISSLQTVDGRRCSGGTTNSFWQNENETHARIRTGDSSFSCSLVWATIIMRLSECHFYPKEGKKNFFRVWLRWILFPIRMFVVPSNFPSFWFDRWRLSRRRWRIFMWFDVYRFLPRQRCFRLCEYKNMCAAHSQVEKEFSHLIEVRLDETEQINSATKHWQVEQIMDD